MILGFVHGLSSQPILCLVSEKPSAFTIPVPISSLRLTDTAIFLLSTEEAIIVSTDSSDGGIVIKPISSSLYLTPNLAHSPGFKIDRMKFIPCGEEKYHTFYDRGRGFEEWNPNTKLA